MTNNEIGPVDEIQDFSCTILLIICQLLNFLLLGKLANMIAELGLK